MSPAQMAELMVRVALNDTLRSTQILALVRRAEYRKIVEYITQFNVAVNEAHIGILPNNEIRDAMLALFLDRLSPYFRRFPPELWGEWFEDYLPYLLPGINAAQISLLETNISCSSYQSVLRGFNKIYNNLPHVTKRSLYNLYIKPFLNNKAIAGGESCNFTSFMQWVSDNLGNFTNLATFHDLLIFQSNFSKVEDTAVLTAEELADLTVISDSLCSDTMTSIVFQKVGSLESYEEIMTYLERLKENMGQVTDQRVTISRCVDQKLLNQLSVQTQQDVLSSILSEEGVGPNITNWLQVFTVLLEEFSSAINESHISALPLNISCGSFHEIIKLLNNLYTRMSKMEVESTFIYCKSYLLQQRMLTGSACASDTLSSTEWITLNFRGFLTRASISDLLDLNPDLDIAVLFGLLTPNEMAEVLVKEDVLANYTLMTRVLNLIDIKNVSEYVTSITVVAKEADLSASQLNMIKETLLSIVFTKLSSNFSTYETQDWEVLFQKDLTILLPEFNRTLLELLPVTMSCSSYQEIIQGFSTAYPSMTTRTKEDIYNYFTKRYFVANSLPGGSVCGTVDLRSWVIFNLGNFIQQSSPQDLILFNTNFTKAENLHGLPPTELADMTFIFDELQDSNMSASIFNEIELLKDSELLLEYLMRIQSLACQSSNFSPNMSSCNQPLGQLSNSTQQTLLTTIMTVLSMEWSLTDMPAWLQAFSIITQNFYVALNETHLSHLPLNISCEDYRAIIKILGGLYFKLNEAEKTTVFTYCKSYLSLQQRYTESACIINVNNTNEWIMANFGPFSTTATVTELQELYPNLEIEALVNLLTPTDMAVLLTKADVLTNSSLLWEILGFIQPRDISKYVISITSAAAMANLSESQLATVKATLLESILFRLDATFSIYKAEDWKILFQRDLVLLLPAFNQTLLGLLPMNISCYSYQEIVRGFSVAYGSISAGTREDIYTVYCKEYLKEQAQSAASTAAPCDDTANVMWVEENLGKFILQSSFEDLIQFNKNFEKVESPNSLMATELADFTFLANTLKSATVTTALVNQIKAFENCGELVEYLFRVQSMNCPNTNISSSVCGGQHVISQLSVTTEQEIFSNIFTLLSKLWNCQNMSTWLQIFNLLLSSFSVAPNPLELSQLPLNISCDYFQAIIKDLNDIYYKFTTEESELIFTYCKAYLTQQEKYTGSACVAPFSSSEDWIKRNLGLFYIRGTLSELTELYPNIDIALVLGILKPSDAPLLFSNPEVLLDNNLFKIAANFVEIEQIPEYMNIITETGKKAHMSDLELGIVKKILLESVFEKISSNFSTYDTNDWRVLFQNDLLPLLPAFTQDLLLELPINLSCPSYQQIVKGFSMSYSSLSSQTKEYFFDYIKRYLGRQLSSAAPACGTEDLRSWVTLNIGNFILQLTTENLVALNQDFTKLENISALTATDLADFTVIAGALNNSTLSAILLSRISEFQHYDDLLEYLMRIQMAICIITDSSSNKSCDQLQPMAQLTARLQKAIVTDLFIVLHQQWSFVNMSKWLQVFDILITDFLFALDETQLSQLPLNISCGDYQAIIMMLSKVFPKLNDLEAKTVYTYCLTYLSQQQESTGSACTAGITDIQDWINMNMGPFSKSATISELLKLYPHLDIGGLLNALTPNDVLELLTKPDVIYNATLLQEVLSVLHPWNILEYVMGITAETSKLNLTDVQISNVKTTLLEACLDKLQSNFSVYEAESWRTLFQTDLVLLLPYFNHDLLLLLPLNITCSSYQEIVKAFNNVYTSLSEEIKNEFYNDFIKLYLIQQSSITGVACDTIDFRTWVNLNLGNFIQQSSSQDIAEFNKNITKLENPEELTVTELATFTFTVDTLNNQTLATILLSRIKEFNSYEEILGYLTTIQNSICQPNDSAPSASSCDQPLSQLSLHTQQEILTNCFIVLNEEWISANMTMWLHIFDILVEVFLPAFDETEISHLPLNISCGEYQAIITTLSNAHSQIIEGLAKSVYSYCIAYLTAQQKSTGSACLSGIKDSTEWITKNFGAFSSKANVPDFVALYPGFDIGVLPGVLTPNDMAELLIKADVLSNETLLISILSRTDTGNVTEYVTAISTAAQKENVSDLQIAMVKQTLLAVVLDKISSNFSSYGTQDWKILFQDDLTLLLPSFNKSLLLLLPINISCSSYQEIVKAFSNDYTSLAEETKNDFYNDFIYRYMGQQASLTGVVCDTIDFRTWVDLNLGNFIQQSSSQDIAVFNKNITKLENPEELTVTELATFTFTVDTLNNQTLATILLSRIKEFNSYEEILGYLTTIQNSICQLNDSAPSASSCDQPLSQLSIHTQQEILTNCFIVLNEEWISANMTMWLHIFDILVEVFLPAFDETEISHLPLHISCGEYQAIITTLSNAHSQIIEGLAKSVYSYCIAYLTAQQKSTGSACLSGIKDSTEWITKNFGAFSSRANVSDFVALYPGFDIGVLPGVLTPNDMAELLIKADVLSNETLLISILSRTDTGNVTEYVTAISKAAQKENVSDLQIAMVKQTLLAVVLDKISSNFSSYGTQDWKILFQDDLTLLLPSFNKSLLLLLPINISCSSFQEIVKAFSNAYTSLSEETKNDFYNDFIYQYMGQQASLTGVVCDTIDFRTWVDLNLGNFIQQSSSQDIAVFNKNITKLENPEELTVTELATFTFTVDTLNNQTLATILLSRIKEFNSYEEILGYLTTIQNSICQPNDSAPSASSCDQPLSQLSLHTQQEILTNCFIVLNEEWISANMTMWLHIFDILVEVFLPAFDETEISHLPLHISCGEYQAIITALSNAHSQIIEGLAKSVYSYCIAYLTAQQKSTGSACLSGIKDSTEWITKNFGAFSSSANVSDFVALYPGFDIGVLPGVLTPNDMAELLIKADVLSNETLLISILSRTNTEDVTEYVTAISTAAQKENVSDLQIAMVKQTLLAVVLDKISSNFSSYGTQDWKILFQDDLTLLLQSFNKSLLLLLPINISCSSYQEIVKAFSNTYTSLSEETKNDFYNDFIYRYMGQQASLTGVACDTIDFRTWVDLNLGNFIQQSSSQDIAVFNKNITKLENPEELTVTELATFTFTVDTLNNQTLATILLSRIKEFNSYEEILGYLTTIQNSICQPNDSAPSASSCDQPLSQLSLHTQQEILTNCFIVLNEEWISANMTMWLHIFDILVEVFLPAFDETEISHLPLDISCGEYQAIITTLSNAHSQIIEGLAKSVYSYCIAYLTAQQKSTGSACLSGIKDSTEWITKNFGAFSSNANVSDFVVLYPGFDIGVLPGVLTPNDMAELLIKADVLSNETLLISILSRTDTENVTDYVTAISTAAQKENVSDLQIAMVKQTLLAVVLDKISSNFSSYGTQDWKILFQDDLTLLLPSFNKSLLLLLPINISCSSFQEIVKAFSNAYTSLSEETKNDFYNDFIYQYMGQQASLTGVVCDTIDFRTWVDLNLGNFIQQSSSQDIAVFNKNITKLENPEELTVTELATFTFTVDTLNNQTLATILLSRIKEFNSYEEILGYLTTIQNSICQPNDSAPSASSCDQPLSQLSLHTQQEILTNCFIVLNEEWISANMTMWLHIFDILVEVFLPAFDETEISHLPLDISCGEYQAIITTLSNAHSQIIDGLAKSVYSYCIAYLTAQQKSTGSACLSGIKDSTEWITKNFGEFSSKANISNFVALYPGFDIGVLPGVLTPNDMAELLIKADVLSNETLLISILSRTDTENVTDYVTAISTAAQKENVSDLQIAMVKQTLLAVVLYKISSNFSSYGTQDWKILFQDDLTLLLPSFNKSLLLLLPINISCSSYQEIVKAFSNAYTSLSEETKNDFYNDFIYQYMGQQASLTGVVCDTIDFRTWVDLNLGNFIQQSSSQDIAVFNKNVTKLENPEELTVTELATFTFTVDTLNNQTLATILLSRIKEFNSYEEILGYLTTIQNSICQPNDSAPSASSCDQPLSQLSLHTQQEILTNCFIVLNEEWISANMTMWLHIFDILVEVFLPAFDETEISHLPLDISCGEYQAIITTLSNAHSQIIEGLAKSVYSYCIAYLTAQQKSTGSACLSGIKDSTEWITKNFGAFSSSANVSDFVALYPGFDIGVLPGVLTPNDMAELLIKADVLSNETLLISILSRTDTGNVTEYVTAISTTAQKENVSDLQIAMVKQTLLAVVLDKISSNFSSYGTQDWKILFQDDLTLLLPSFNKSLLLLLPINISCSSYQEIVKAFSSAYTSLSEETKNDFYNDFIHQYMGQQASLTGVVCDTIDFRTWVNLNLGNFIQQSSSQDIAVFNKNITKLENPEELTVTELATFTFTVDTLNNQTLATILLSRIKEFNSYEEILGYLTTIQNSICQPNDSAPSASSCDQPLSQLSLHTQQEILTNCFIVLNEEWISANMTMWLHIFDILVEVFLPAFDETEISHLPLHISCGEYQAIITALSNAHSQIIEGLAKSVYSYCIAYLTAQQKSTGSACLSGIKDSTEWITKNFGAFSSSANVSDFVALYPGFDIGVLPGVLTPNDMAELLIKADVLSNETLLISILSRTDTENVTEYVTAISTAAQKGNVSDLQIAMVKQTLLAVVLDKISSNFSSYGTQDWKILFQDDLTLLLPSFNKSLLLLLPINISCSSYQEIVKAFSNAYTSLSEETKNDFYNDFIYRYMGQQASLTGVACDTLDFRTWVELNLGNFIEQSSSQDIAVFNKNITKLENPEELTVTELATFTFTVDTLNNQTLATILLSRIKEFNSYEEILGYLTTIQNSICQPNDSAPSASSCDQPLSQLSIHTQQEILTNCFIVLNEEWISANMTTWLHIFDILVEVFLPAFDETEISHLPLDISCGEYQAIITTLSNAHSQIIEGLAKSVYSYCIAYLTAQQKSTGSACLSGIKDSTEWITKNFGAFSSRANVSDFVALYPGFDIGVLPGVLTPNDMAELLIKADVLSNETLLISILSRTDTENVTEYVTAISTTAQKENVSDLQIAMVKQTLLAVVLDKISSNFSSYGMQNWKILFQDDLTLLLPSFNKSLLLLLPINISCSSYQEIVKAFSNDYTSLSEETKNDFYNDFIYRYMGQQASLTGVACDTLDFRTWVELNLGNFIQQSSSQDIAVFNKNITKLENPEELTVTELATFTFTVDTLNNQTLATILLSRIKEFNSYEEILGYLTTIQNSICQPNDSAPSASSCDQPLSQLSIHTQQEILTNCFIVLNEEWISANMTTWLHIFDILVEVFLPAFDETEISHLPLDISCGEYQAIITTLSNAHSQIIEGLAKSVYSYCIAYLTAQQKSTGSACLSGIKDSTEWITKNFGAFSSSANVSDFVALYSGFDIGVLPGVLTPNDMAELLIKADVLSNETLLISILIRTNTENVTEYVTAISTAAQKENVSDLQIAMVKQTLLAVVLDKISSNFSSYGTQDWKILFQDDLTLLLPSFNKSLLLLLPINISCSSYQEIVKAFSNDYTSLSEETKNYFYNDFIYRYMGQQASLTGVVCDTIDFRTWVNLNLGNFIQQSSSQDIAVFNKNITKLENPEELTVTELATFTFTVDTLNNQTLATILLGRIKEFNSYEEILGYLTTIQNSICQPNDSAPSASSCDQPLSQLSLHTQQEILTNCFIVLNEEWISANMTMWLHIFDILVEVFLPAFDETEISHLPLNISCGEYQAIITTLSNAHSQIIEGLAKSVYSYCIAYLTAQQKSTGSACLSGIKDSTEWITKNFGAFSSRANVSDFVALYPGFDIGVLPGVLTPNDMAELLIKADVLSNETLLISILSRTDTENVTEYVTAISTTAQKENVSDLQIAMVKQTLLAVVLDKISSNFSSYGMQNWKILFQDDLTLLLPSFNKSLLLLLPINISCSSYQEIVKAFSNTYTSLSEETKNDFYNDFIYRYMGQQASLTGVACDTIDFRTWVNLNLGNFIQQSSSQDIAVFNKNITKLENPGELTVTELATFTFTVDTLNNQTLATILLSRIKEFNSYEEILGYLTKIQNSICQPNDSAPSASSCDQPLSQLNLHTQQEILTNCFIVLNEEWISANMTMWLHIFDILVEVFLPAFDETEISHLPLDISCGEYQAIITTLSNAHSQIIEGLAKSVYSYCIAYLTAQQKSTGSACLSGIKDSTEWITKNFGAFSSSANVSDFVALYPGFDIGVLPGVLTPNDMAELLVKADVISNETLLISILSRTDTENVTDYVTAISTAAQKENVSDLQIAMVKQTLLAVVLYKISSNFSSYGTQDWKILFQDDLTLLLPSFNKTLLLLLPINISCSSYQEIVKAFSNAYTSLSDETKNDFYNYFIYRYMGQQASPTGVVCDTINFRSWIDINLGNFIQQSTLNDIALFNKNITKLENPEELTVTELATFTFTVDTLNNQTLATILLSRIKEFNSYEEILGYLTTIQNSICQSNDPLSSISSCGQLSIHTQQEILTNCFIVLNEKWILNNMTMWLHIFDILVEVFLPAFDETQLSQLPLNVSCENYQAIIKTLSSKYAQMTDAVAKSVYAYCKSYLIQQQKLTGQACYTSNFAKWMDDNFGNFGQLAAPGDLLMFNKNFTQDLNTLKPQEFLNLLELDVNITLWEILLSGYTNITQLGQVMDGLNIKMVNLSQEVHQGVFRVVWPTFLTSLTFLDATDLSDWLNIRFSDYLPYLTKAQLDVPEVISASCLFYKNLVKTLSRNYGKFTDNTRQDFYSVFKAYLLNSASIPRCYNSAEANANSWIFYYLNDYFTYCSSSDLKSFCGDELLLEEFSLDPLTLELVGGLKLSEDLKSYYAELMAAGDPSISLQIIPDNLLCYVIDMISIDITNQNLALSTLMSLKKCNKTSGNVGADVLASILTSVDNFTAETFQTLGQIAVALLPSVIMEKTDGAVLLQSLSSLSQVNDWNPTQASVIVTKLQGVGFQFNATTMEALGTLVIGVGVKDIDKLKASDFLVLANNGTFVSQMQQAPPALQQRFVQLLINSTTDSILQAVPSSMASAIPPSVLVKAATNITDINNMQWTANQAQVLFQTVLNLTQDYSVLSTNVLKGFTCGAANMLGDTQFVGLIKAMKGKTAALDYTQLSCIGKRLTLQSYPSDFASYPSDVLLYMGPSPSNCTQYYSLVGKSNTGALPAGSSILGSLLSSARTCLGINGTSLTVQNLQVLGSLSCGLSANEINNSNPFILSLLQSCPSFGTGQAAAIESQILRLYGPASQWTVITMSEIGNLSSTLSASTLQKIPQIVKISFFPGYLTKLKALNMTLFKMVLKQLKPARVARQTAINCTTPLTTDIISKQTDLIVISYSAADLENCLSNDILNENLQTLGELAFEGDQLNVLKTKLDMLYPGGIPEQYLLQLGNIAMVYSTDQIAKWNITKLDTLATLLQMAPWQSNDVKVQAMVDRYLQAPGATLDGTALTILSPYLCALNQSQIESLQIADIRASTSLPDTSTCSQSMKNVIFNKMKSAYQSSARSQNAYYQLLKSVIGGASSADLIQFANGSPEMDIDIFQNLNPNEVKMLSAQNIVDLMGVNLPDLRSISDSNIVQLWASVHTQAEVNSLGLNILAGVKETTPRGFIIITLQSTTPASGGDSPKHHSFILALCTLFAMLLSLDSFH
ncbi:uncharacterized protein LOC101733470 isoform X4 [Xenopus tropicalis]|uniref:Uncharacterized protein LOC101733470 isoform X4 n=1 Tax=Xenopus tropicalis TaxID=8364 RepID=A0A8J1IX62_XENTR|nr:uncharacterized protein LOC101733470 isoform X4 [Xenopus tropicalis]